MKVGASFFFLAMATFLLPKTVVPFFAAVLGVIVGAVIFLRGLILGYYGYLYVFEPRLLVYKSILILGFTLSYSFACPTD